MEQRLILYNDKESQLGQSSSTMLWKCNSLIWKYKIIVVIVLVSSSFKGHVAFRYKAICRTLRNNAFMVNRK